MLRRPGGLLKPPEGCASLDDVRHAIDALDREIVALIGRRTRYIEKAARFKTGASSVRAPERQSTMLKQRRRWAEEESPDPDVIDGSTRA